MAAPNMSLFQYLTQRNPLLNVENGGKGQNTTSHRRLWKEPDIITDWNDFRPESLSSIYNGQLKQILSKKFPCPELPDIAPFPFCEIHDEDSLECFLTLWSQQIVSNALTITQDSLSSLCTSGRIYMARGGQAELLRSFPKNDKRRRCHPDWAAVKKMACANGKQSKPRNILPGDTKLSSKWRSSMVQKGDKMTYLRKPDSVRPILQVFNYCLNANTRYGYIITDQELVVLRVGVSEFLKEETKIHLDGHKPNIGIKEETVIEENENEGNEKSLPSEVHESQDSQAAYASEAQRRARKFGKVELMSIPWDHSESDRRPIDSLLTVNLALWWIHILAATESSIELEYPSLSEEELPLLPTSNNVSFSAQIADLDLAASFGSRDGDHGRRARKRKLDSSHPTYKLAKRQ